MAWFRPDRFRRVVSYSNELDNGYNAPESGHHNWVMANNRMSAALLAKGYHGGTCSRRRWVTAQARRIERRSPMR